MDKTVQHDEIYMWSNVCFNPLSHGVTALFSSPGWRLCELLPSLRVYRCPSALLTVFQNSSIFNRTDVGIFDPLKTWPLLLKIEQRGSDSSLSHISPKPLDLAEFFQLLK